MFECEWDMKDAYKNAHKLEVLDKPVLVDVERGRTGRGWLDGGLVDWELVVVGGPNRNLELPGRTTGTRSECVIGQ